MQPYLSRRKWLEQSAGGFGGLALGAMMQGESLAREEAVSQIIHHPPKVKRVVQLLMAGAASSLDMFDFKPALVKHHGEPSDFGEKVEAFQNGLGPWMKSPWEFQAYC